MRRRDFLEASAAGAGALMLQSPIMAAVAPEPALEIGHLLLRGVIWCRNPAPVALSRGGRAGDIADVGSQGHGQGIDFFSDDHAAFIKTFEISESAGPAVLHIFAYTRYRLYINGAYVGRGPGRYQNQRPEYDSWPATEYLKAGRNRICVLASRDSPTGRIMYHSAGMTALMMFKDAEGAHRLVTDETWQARPEVSFRARDVAWASIQENIDARMGEDWLAAGYDASHWPAAVAVPADQGIELQPRTIPLLRETVLPWRKAFTPTELLAGDSVEFDLAYPTLAYHRLGFSADASSRIEVIYGLPENQSSGRSSYIARLGAQVWEGGDTSAFTRLTVKVTAGRIQLNSAQAVQVVYPFDRIGRFTSSDEMLNRLWMLCARSLEVLSEDAYIDCADRERVEWTDETPPAFECTRVMMAGPAPGGGPVYSDPRLLKALLQRIAMTQKGDGQIKAHSCSERWDIHAIMEDRSCDWIIALRQYFDATSDTTFVREMWPTVKRLLDWFLRQRTARGLVLAREWEVWDNPLRYQVCEGAGLNAFVYHALTDAAHLGVACGCRADGRHFKAAAYDLSQAFNDLLWDDSEGAYFGGLFGAGSKLGEQLNGKVFAGPFDRGRYRPTLQAALFALDAGIVPASRRSRLEEWIMAHQDEAKLCMSHHFLFKTLYGLRRANADRRVLELVRAKWRPMTDSTWGTSWEGLEDWGGSKVHIYGIVPAYFLSAFVLGVRVDGPVMRRRLLIEPRPGDLSHAEGVVVTEFGPVPIGWQRTGSGGMVLDVTIPAKCSARLRLYRQRHRRVELNGRKTSVTPTGDMVQLDLTSGRHQVVQV